MYSKCKINTTNSLVPTNKVVPNIELTITVPSGVSHMKNLTA